jgi:hypothetical protein
MTAGLKTLSYTDATAALVEARRAGADEAIFLDTRDRCSEAASSNLFAWDGATLLTPPLSCGALPGITRDAVLASRPRAACPRTSGRSGSTKLVARARRSSRAPLREARPARARGRARAGRRAPRAGDARARRAYRDLVRADVRGVTRRVPPSPGANESSRRS